VRHPKIQTKRCAARPSNALQELNDVERDFRKIVEQADDFDALKSVNILQAYKEGKVTMILNFTVPPDKETDRPISTNRNSISPGSFAQLVYQRKALDCGTNECGDKEFVFVSGIQVTEVNEHGASIIPSAVRLYIGDNPVVQGRGQFMYFDALERAFKVSLSRADWKFRPLSLGGTCVLHDGPYIGMVDSTVEVMDGISDNHPQLCQKTVDFGRSVSNLLQVLRISEVFDSSNVTIWQIGDKQLDFCNVLFGPFYFQSSGSKAIEHGSWE
jgi:hypothetical protein